MVTTRTRAGALALALVVVLAVGARPADAASKAEIEKSVDAALAKLYADVPEAKQLAAKTRAILVFPRVYKAGFLYGAQYGDGALRQRGKTTGYYNTVAASYGFQAGVQAFGYALFFMNDGALGYLGKSEGFEIGVGPSITVVDAGVARALTTTTAHKDIYAFIFDQKGLMAGAGIQGSKISKLDR